MTASLPLLPAAVESCFAGAGPALTAERFRHTRASRHAVDGTRYSWVGTPGHPPGRSAKRQVTCQGALSVLQTNHAQCLCALSSHRRHAMEGQKEGHKAFFCRRHTRASWISLPSAYLPDTVQPLLHATAPSRQSIRGRAQRINGWRIASPTEGANAPYFSSWLSHVLEMARRLRTLHYAGNHFSLIGGPANCARPFP